MDFELLACPGHIVRGLRPVASRALRLYIGFAPYPQGRSNAAKLGRE